MNESRAFDIPLFRTVNHVGMALPDDLNMSILEGQRSRRRKHSERHGIDQSEFVGKQSPSGVHRAAQSVLLPDPEGAGMIITRPARSTTAACTVVH